MDFFYDQPINCDFEEQRIKKILSKYQHTPFSEELKKRIYDDLTRAKAEGVIAAPFKVVTRKDPTGVHRAYIEVVIDTQV